jgi:hypothetical protein
MVKRNVALLLVLSAPTALAQPRPSRAEREASAQIACATGHPDEGSAILAALYAEYGHRNYVYNQARCYQQNGRGTEAVNRFHEYLRLAPDAPAEERARIDGYLRDLQAASVPPPEVHHPPSPQPLAPAPQLLAPARPPVSQSLPASPGGRGGLRTGAIALGVVGVAGLVGGALATHQVQQVDQEVEGWARKQPGAVTTIDLADAEARGARYRTLSVIGYGLGAAALVGSAACAYFGWRDLGPRNSDFALSFEPGGVHAHLRLGL